jgi:hypothetical protein
MLQSNKHVAFLGMLVLLIGCPLHVSAANIVFSSGTDWEVFNADPAGPGAVLLGLAQNVCLNATSPVACPPGSTLYGYVNGWAADLSTVPTATWIWADGLDGSTSPADFQEFFFSKTFFLASPVSGTISVAVDDFAEIRVNGVVAGMTGSITDRASAVLAQNTLAVFDITPFLIPGSNIITVRAQNGPPSYGGCPINCTYALNPAGVVFGGRLSDIPEPQSAVLVVSAALFLALAKMRRT